MHKMERACRIGAAALAGGLAAALGWMWRQKAETEKALWRVQDLRGEEQRALRAQCDDFARELEAARHLLEQARQEAERWKKAAGHSREMGIREVMNLLNYKGSEEGQIDVSGEG